MLRASDHVAVSASLLCSLVLKLYALVRTCTSRSQDLAVATFRGKHDHCDGLSVCVSTWESQGTPCCYPDIAVYDFVGQQHRQLARGLQITDCWLQAMVPRHETTAGMRQMD